MHLDGRSIARVELILKSDNIGLFLKVQRQGKSALVKAAQHLSDGGNGLGPDTADLHVIKSYIVKPHKESALAISIPMAATITNVANNMTKFCFASILIDRFQILSSFSFFGGVVFMKVVKGLYKGVL